MAYKPSPPIPAMNIHWKPPRMTLIAPRGIGPPYALLQAHLQSVDMNYPMITPLPFVLGRDMLPYPPKCALVAKVKLCLYLPHGQPSIR